jgi:hypothetical protein
MAKLSETRLRHHNECSALNMQTNLSKCLSWGEQLTISAVTLEQIVGMVEALPTPDQERLVARLNERLASRQEYFARAEAFITTCLENPIVPACGMDSGIAIAEMRDELL